MLKQITYRFYREEWTVERLIMFGSSLSTVPPTRLSLCLHKGNENYFMTILPLSELIFWLCGLCIELSIVAVKLRKVLDDTPRVNYFILTFMWDGCENWKCSVEGKVKSFHHQLLTPEIGDRTNWMGNTN